MQKVTEKIARSPEIKTAIFILSVVVSGILCSGFVTEITQNGVLVWHSFYKVTTFWLIMAYCILIYFYNKMILNYERDILKYLDEKYCKAYIVNACLPEITERYKTEIRNGKNPSDILDIGKELKKLLK